MLILIQPVIAEKFHTELDNYNLAKRKSWRLCNKKNNRYYFITVYSGHCIFHAAVYSSLLLLLNGNQDGKAILSILLSEPAEDLKYLSFISSHVHNDSGC